MKKWVFKSLIVVLLLISNIPLAVNAQRLPEAESLLPEGITALKNPNVIPQTGKEGESYGRILSVNTYELLSKENIWRARVNKPVKEGDVLWLAFEARCLQSKRETGEGLIQFSLDRFVNGKYDWPPYLERSVSVGNGWVSVSIPFIANHHVGPGELSLVMNMGKVPQVIELRALQLLNYKKTVRYDQLPKSVVNYEGGEPDAAWRKPAAERIDRYRKADLTIKVIDHHGRPVPEVKVKVDLSRLNFAIGTATNSSVLLDTLSEEGKKYRDTLFRYFNKVVLENEVKWMNWGNGNHRQTYAALDYLKKMNMPVRGHVMVWPSWQYTPKGLKKLQNDTSALSSYILNSIATQTKDLKGRFIEWDVINEPYAHHDLLDILGRHKMVDWFVAAHQGAPDVKLFLNDYTMFQGDGPGSASDKFFQNLKYLISNGAPVQAIGEQGHVGGSPPGIDLVLSRLDKFSEFGLPIQISEFDITSDDDDFKKRYMKDFMTAVFSNPNTIGFMQWGFWEGSHWIPSAALWDKEWKIRPQGQIFTSLVSKEWSTHEQGLTGNDGSYRVRGFNGDYEITLFTKKSHITKHAVLKRGGTELTVILDGQTD